MEDVMGVEYFCFQLYINRNKPIPVRITAQPLNLAPDKQLLVQDLKKANTRSMWKLIWQIMGGITRWWCLDADLVLLQKLVVDFSLQKGGWLF